MNSLRHLLLALLLAGLALPATGCWQVLALQGAMAAAQIAGAEADTNPDVEYCDQQDQFIKDYFAKDKYDMAPEDKALAGVRQPTAQEMAPSVASAPSSGNQQKPASNSSEGKSATTLASEFSGIPPTP